MDAQFCTDMAAAEVAVASPTKRDKAKAAAWRGLAERLTPPAPAPPPSSSPQPYPAKAQAVYYMMWANSPAVRLRDLPASVNVVNLAFLQGGGLVDWGPFGKATTLADLAELRARGVRVVLSIGGQGGTVNTSDRAGLIAAVKAVAAQTPLDGIDWDIEAGATFPTADVVAISTALKADGYAVTMAPNGSNVAAYLACAVQLHKAGALDMYGQQFYAAVVPKEAARWRVDQAVTAGLPESKIAVGMMVGTTTDTWTVAQCAAAVAYVKATHPGLRGGYLWEAGRVGTADWAAQTGPLLL